MVIFDSSVLIDQVRTNCYSGRIDSLDELVRTSAVVLAELWRGATDHAEQVFLRKLERNYAIFAPTEKNWLESGEILSRIQRDHGFEGRKLRDLHFDVMIALTVRSHGARLITTNRADFELIRAYRDFQTRGLALVSSPQMFGKRRAGFEAGNTPRTPERPEPSIFKVRHSSGAARYTPSEVPGQLQIR